MPLPAVAIPIAMTVAQVAAGVGSAVCNTVKKKRKKEKLKKAEEAEEEKKKDENAQTDGKAAKGPRIPSKQMRPRLPVPRRPPMPPRRTHQRIRPGYREQGRGEMGRRWQNEREERGRGRGRGGRPRRPSFSSSSSSSSNESGESTQRRQPMTVPIDQLMSPLLPRQPLTTCDKWLESRYNEVIIASLLEIMGRPVYPDYYQKFLYDTSHGVCPPYSTCSPLTRSHTIAHHQQPYPCYHQSSPFTYANAIDFGTPSPFYGHGGNTGPTPFPSNFIPVDCHKCSLFHLSAHNPPL